MTNTYNNSKHDGDGETHRPPTVDRGELRNGRLSQIKNYNADEDSQPNEFYSELDEE
ncbi:hypothetical protein MJA45_16175 [Paenibacillus aurantius]|uniref:Uncharacterized protein n=1 Tax=Paenibacillus aurantius TaxID=2918900 RepID=A0AA96L9I5_9BACL|nr:hypothetical protein [Paenibacillus aurantius]WNQ09180.1 hypothetical protein MJA45_16175 [Paenibacillus aurantius]